MVAVLTLRGPSPKVGGETGPPLKGCGSRARYLRNYRCFCLDDGKCRVIREARRRSPLGDARSWVLGAPASNLEAPRWLSGVRVDFPSRIHCEDTFGGPRGLVGRSRRLGSVARFTALSERASRIYMASLLPQKPRMDPGWGLGRAFSRRERSAGDTWCHLIVAESSPLQGHISLDTQSAGPIAFGAGDNQGVPP